MSTETVLKRIERTGDGTKSTHKKTSKMNVNEIINDTNNNCIWGWDDNDMTSDYKNCIDICYKKLD